MAKKSIRTRKADVYGDDVSGVDVNMQTGNHEGQICTVRKNVTIQYEKPRPWKKANKLDDEGSCSETASANIAIVNAKEIHGPWSAIVNGRKQRKITAKRDVTIIYDDPSETSRRRKQ